MKRPQIQICPFEQMEPEDWFHLLESQFSKNGYTTQKLKNNATFKLLPWDVTKNIFTQKYDELKHAVLQQFGRKPPTTHSILKPPTQTFKADVCSANFSTDQDPEPDSESEDFDTDSVSETAYALSDLQVLAIFYPDSSFADPYSDPDFEADSDSEDFESDSVSADFHTAPDCNTDSLPADLHHDTVAIPSVLHTDTVAVPANLHPDTVAISANLHHDTVALPTDVFQFDFLQESILCPNVDVQFEFDRLVFRPASCR